LSATQRIKSVDTKATRPISIPSNFNGLRSRELGVNLKVRRIERSKTFDNFLYTAQWHSLPARQRTKDEGTKITKETVLKTGNYGHTVQRRHPKVENCKTHRKIERKRENISQPKRHEPEDSENSESKLIPDERKETNNRKIRSRKHANRKPLNETCPDVEVLQEESSFLGYTPDEERNRATEDNSTSFNQYANINATKLQKSRDRSRSVTSSLMHIGYCATPLPKDDKHLSRSQRLELLPLLETYPSRSGRDSNSKTKGNPKCFEKDFEGSKAIQRFLDRRMTTPKRAESRSKATCSMSTTKLAAIISETILRHAKSRLSMSSNQKTSILTNYARMLQNQLNMDDVPESKSPDFSETPFMRSRNDQHEDTENSKKNEQGFRSTENVQTSTLWKNHLGNLQENVHNNKERRRLNVPFFVAAGIVTRKEKQQDRLTKLRIKHREKTVYEKVEENKGKENSPSKNEK
jgi:hypothetical protein